MNLSEFNQNNLTYQRALSNILNAKYQHTSGGDAVNNIKYKVYHWIDKRGMERYESHIKLPDKIKPIRKCFSGDTGQAKAWRFIFDVIDKYNLNGSIDSLVKPDITIAQFIKSYETTYLSKLRQNKKNIKQQKNRLKFISNSFGKIKLKLLNVNDIENYRLNRMKTVSNNTINKEVALLSAFMTAAVNKEFITKNICRKVKKLEIIKSIQRMPITNIKSIFKAVWKYTELRDYCFLMYYTGLRCSDIIDLKKENIRTKDNMTYFELIESKTNKKIIIPIHPVLFENGIITDTEYVFQYSKSRDNAVSYLNKKFKSVIKNITEQNITAYWFRHTFQDTLESAGIAEGTIRHLMGKNLSGSLNFYSHANLERMKDAIETIPKYNFFALFSHQEKKLLNEISNEGSESA